MNNKVSYRYARGLFELAKDKNLLKDFLNDCQLILRYEQNIGLSDLITNPTLSKEKKLEVFMETFKNHVSRKFLDFFKLLLNKGREIYLFSIAKNYIKLDNQLNSIIVAEVISATPLENNILDKVKEKFASMGDVEITQTVDKNIVGGIIVKVGDLQYDLSIRNQINSVKRAFKI